MAISWYGDFELTEAIRPSPDKKKCVIPREGYRHDVYREYYQAAGIPVILAAATRTKLFDLFIELTEEMGEMVDVILEASHEPGPPTKFCRESIDSIVLRSKLWDHQDTLLDDGCAGIFIINPDEGIELQFDEHKSFAIYPGKHVDRFEAILRQYDLKYDESMLFIREGEHIHHSDEGLKERFTELTDQINGGYDHYDHSHDEDDDFFSCSQ